MGRLSLCVLVFMSVVAAVLSDTAPAAAAPAAAAPAAAAPAAAAPAAAAAAPAAPAAAAAPAAPGAAAVPALPQNNIMTGAIKLMTSIPKGVITMCKDMTDGFLEMFSFGK